MSTEYICKARGLSKMPFPSQMRGMRLALANRLLLSLEGPEHVKAWRPRLMLIGFDDNQNPDKSPPTEGAKKDRRAKGADIDVDDSQSVEATLTSYTQLLALAEQLMTGKGFAVATKFIQRSKLEALDPTELPPEVLQGSLRNSTMNIALASPSVYVYQEFGDSADPCVNLDSVGAGGRPSDRLTSLMAWAIRHKQTILEENMRKRAVHGCAQIIIYESAKALPLVTWAALQAVGLGALTPNTILIAFPKEVKWKKEVTVDFWYKIHRSIDLDMTLVLAKGDFPIGKRVMKGTIDIWWILHDGGVVLLLPFLLRRHRVWERCHLRIFAAAEMNDDVSGMEKALRNWLFELRIEATVRVVQFKNETIRPYAAGRAEAVAERRRFKQSFSMETMPGTPKSDETKSSREKVVDVDPQLLADKCMGASTEKESGTETHTESTSMGDKSVTVTQGDTDTLSRSQEVAVQKADEPAATPINKETADIVSHTHAPDMDERSHPDISEASTAYSLDRTLDSQRLRQAQRATFFYDATELNEAIVAHSLQSAALVVLNVPRPPDDTALMRPYLMYLEQVTRRLPRVMLIRGTGKQVVTSYN